MTVPLPQDAKCSCGRLRSEAEVHVMHTHERRYAFWRCECGQEWNDRQADVDPVEAVTSEEVISVHERMAGPDFSLKDLLGG